MLKLVRPLSYLLSISLIVFLLPLNTYAATPTYHYEWVSQSGTISSDGLAHEYTNLQAGQIITLYLTLYNRTNNTIKGRHRLGNPDNGRQVQTGAWGIGSQTPYQDGTPYFLDTSSFVLNNNRFTYYDGEDVPDNEAITMSWNIKLKDNLSDGIYNLYVRPVSEYKAWTRQVKNGKLLPSTDSDIFWRLVVGEGWQTYIKTYTSENLGVTFDYFSHPDIMLVDVTESGNKICLQSCDGQFVEVFYKDSGDNLITAVQKEFLPSISEADCKAIAYKDGLNYFGSNTEAVEIEYGFTPTEPGDPRYSTSPCPASYSKTNGVRYFWMDKSHPDRFFFFSIGQYGIWAEYPHGTWVDDNPSDRLLWQDTFRVF